MKKTYLHRENSYLSKLLVKLKKEKKKKRGLYTLVKAAVSEGKESHLRVPLTFENFVIAQVNIKSRLTRARKEKMALILRGLIPKSSYELKVKDSSFEGPAFGRKRRAWGYQFRTR